MFKFCSAKPGLKWHAFPSEEDHFHTYKTLEKHCWYVCMTMCGLYVYDFDVDWPMFIHFSYSWPGQREHEEIPLRFLFSLSLSDSSRTVSISKSICWIHQNAFGIIHDWARLIFRSSHGSTLRSSLTLENLFRYSHWCYIILSFIIQCITLYCFMLYCIALRKL